MKRHNRQHAGKATRQHGLTLIELMISMTLGLLLTVGVVNVFVGNRATYGLQEGVAWVQENARFALEHMADRTRMAGYIGCLTNVTMNNHLDGAANPFRDDIIGGIQGYEANGTAADDDFAAGAINPAPSTNASDWTPALPTELGNPGLVIPGSDAFVVRFVAGQSNPLVAPYSDDKHLFVGDGTIEPEEGQILVVTDCLKASLFQATKVDDVSFGWEVEHKDDGSFTPSNVSEDWPVQESYGLGSEIAQLQAIAFYIGRGQNNTPALFQLRLQATDAETTEFVAEELVEGVDSMQVRYGVDNDGDQQVNVWQSANTVDAAANWGNVLSVEISILTRSAEEYGTTVDSAEYNVGGMRFDPVDDRRLRYVFSTTVGIRNRLP